MEGNSARFFILATGEGTLSYQWRKGGQAIRGATGPELILPNVKIKQSGNYDCVVTVRLNGAASTTTSNVAVLTVDHAVIPSISFSPNNYTFTRGVIIPVVTPINTGGSSTNWSITPILPLGLSFDSTTGAISGIPLASKALTNFTIAASNAAGSSTAILSITVLEPAPNGLTYSTNPATYTKGVAISANTPSSTGGAITSYGVNPALPAGLSLNTTTGVITGTPTTLTAAANYTVTATNASGSTTAVLSITVVAAAPNGLTYSTNPATYTKGVAIPANTPSSTGGAITSYGVNPALPAGLSLNTTTGVIIGTPTTLTAAANYTVTATNASGSTTAVLSITVVAAAPNGLTYSTNPATYTKGVAISANTPSSTGGAVTSFAVTPALPAGLSLNSSTGVITGIPTTLAAAANYTVTATNASGSTTAVLSIAVVDAAPNGLTYTTNPATYTKGVAISANTPSSTGGAVTSYAVTPALPAGLSLNTTTGVITGTPTAFLTATNYRVFGSNSGGSTSVDLSISVIDLPPSNLTYTYSTATFTVGNAISQNSPTNNGGVVISYSVTPALPNGLGIMAGTGVITGTPTTITDLTTYTVIATNSGGTTTAELVFKVVPSGPGISTQPIDASSPEGGTANFSVIASGSGNLSYQWQKNSVNIPGATSSNYTTPTLAPADTGSIYRVLVSDSYGSVTTSSDALLTVIRRFTISGDLQVGRAYHTETLLPNGKVLIAGGHAPDLIAVAELYDPATGLFTPTGSLVTPRSFHTATLLSNGKVLLTGGGAPGGGSYSNAEIYDPSTGLFTATGSMGTGRNRHTATLLSNGKVLLAGGGYLNNAVIGSAELYNPTTGTFTYTGSLFRPRTAHTATKLSNGKVLLAGGIDQQAGQMGYYLQDAELYDPGMGLFTRVVNGMASTRASHTATLLPSGKVLLAGGRGGYNMIWLSTVDLFDSSTGLFSSTGSLSRAREFHTATLLPNGKVLIGGGYGSPYVHLSLSELYDPATGLFSYGGSLNTERSAHTATLLPGGKILFVGGTNFTWLVSSELFQ